LADGDRFYFKLCVLPQEIPCFRKKLPTPARL
jgi:hypothetical protein